VEILTASPVTSQEMGHQVAGSVIGEGAPWPGLGPSVNVRACAYVHMYVYNGACVRVWTCERGRKCKFVRVRVCMSRCV
jgi:hypothetical protein